MVMVWAAATTAASSFSKIPEIKTSDDQNKLLGEATANVMRHFPSVLTDKQQDFMALIFAIGTVGMVQVSLYEARRRSDKARDITPASDVNDAFKFGAGETAP